MDKSEFIEILQKTLTGRVNSRNVEENVRYYQDYIEAQLRMGISERVLMEQLGDPRLLAKSIIEASKHTGLDTEYEVNEVYEDGETYHEEAKQTKVFRMPGWLVLLIVLFIIVIIFGMITSLLSFVLPILLPIICVVSIVRFFQRRR